MIALIIPVSLILLFILVRKFYKYRAKMQNEKRKKRLKAELEREIELDWLLSMDEHEKAISN